jgi:hypothetical protein
MGPPSGGRGGGRLHLRMSQTLACGSRWARRSRWCTGCGRSAARRSLDHLDARDGTRAALRRPHLRQSRPGRLLGRSPQPLLLRFSCIEGSLLLSLPSKHFRIRKSLIHDTPSVILQYRALSVHTEREALVSCLIGRRVRWGLHMGKSRRPWTSHGKRLHNCNQLKGLRARAPWPIRVTAPGDGFFLPGRSGGRTSWRKPSSGRGCSEERIACSSILTIFQQSRGNLWMAEGG